MTLAALLAHLAITGNLTGWADRRLLRTPRVGHNGMTHDDEGAFHPLNFTLLGRSIEGSAVHG
jgi:hypothetical protein